MKKKPVLLLVICSAFFIIVSCQRNISDFAPGTGTTTSGITAASIAGTYSLKALTWSYQGVTINVFDSLPSCEQDNLYKFNADLTANYIDAGTPCSPPENGSATWFLRNDSLYLSSSPDGAKIKSFDGRTLVLTGSPSADPGVIAVTTYVKQ